MLALSKSHRPAWLAVLVLAVAGIVLVLASPGAGRAQVVAVPIPQLTLLPGNEVPPVEANAIGYFSGAVAADHMLFDLSADGDTFTQAHIHNGAPGTNGPPVVFLFGPMEGQKSIHPTGRIDASNLVGPFAGDFKKFTDALAKGELYVNVHSIDNPAVVVRVQLTAITVPTPPTPTATGTGTAAPTGTPRPPVTGTGSADSAGWGSTELIGGVLLVLAAGSFVALMAVRRRR